MNTPTEIFLKGGFKVEAAKFQNVIRWLRLFAYISATVLLITNDNIDKLKYVIPILIFIFLINYSRDYLMVSGDKPIYYIWISLISEMLLILSIGVIDQNDINLLLFFICVSSAVIIHPFFYSIVLVIVYLAATFYIYALRHGSADLMKSIVPMLFNYGVSIVFVIVMSYLVKIQMREKEKLVRINAELEQAYKKLIENSAAAHRLTVEAERTRMAREIHDTLAHTLTTLIIQLEACKRLAVLDPTRLSGELEKAQQLSRSGFNDVKRSIKALRPGAMDNKSFITSIISMINDTMASTKVHICLNNLLGSDIELASQQEIALFRAVQESITNSIRHGKADRIEINLINEEGQLKASIIDNGIGCANIKKGYGMRGIRERIESLNGKVEFLSSSGKGFTTRILIPSEGGLEHENKSNDHG